MNAHTDLHQAQLFILRDIQGDTNVALIAETTDELMTLIVVVIESVRDCEVLNIPVEPQELEQVLQTPNITFDFEATLTWDYDEQDTLPFTIERTPPFSMDRLK
jgi:hypothetical protein